ncbi:MAG: cobalamin biosynthesis protein CobQ [Oscillospiraceae bacterium]|nr:cobalamin biosynthesis protein CobQ [Oscillospiraceae bacterium]
MCIERVPKITIVTGHYGAGKTNFAVNLALSVKKAGESVKIADLDIVNPYFRTAEYKSLFKKNGVDLIASDFAAGSVDVPAINLDLKGAVDRSDRVILDVGGDPEGAKVLGRFSPVIKEYGYEMIYVINRYRYLTQSAGQAVELMRLIEDSSGLKCTALFNNSHLGEETTAAVIAESKPFAEEVVRITGLKLIELPVKVYVKPPWQLTNN